MRALRNAIGFLTSLNVRPGREMQTGDLGRAAAWFPFVGLAIGGLLWAVHRLLSPHVPQLPLAATLTALWVVVTGALHLDGLADCCDALFAAAPPERRLEILKDSRAGAFAVVGVSLLLMLKVSAISELRDPRALILAPVLGRWWMLATAASKPASNQGLGAALHSEITYSKLIPAGLLTAAAVIPFAIRGGIALLATGAGALVWIRLAKTKIGGHNGDVLGAICELSEWIAMLIFTWTN